MARRSLKRMAGAVGIALALSCSMVPGASGQSASGLTATAPPPPPANPAIVGRITLSGYGTKLAEPTAPTSKPLYTDCHQLVDPAFQGQCIIVKGHHGWVAGVVEQEHGARGTQERELVWHRQADHWQLALVRVLVSPANPGRLWAAALRPGHDRYLVFVSPVAAAGFGGDLSLVSTGGRVVLYRFLGQGFAEVPRFGGLLTYVPGFTEALPANSYFDQALIGWAGGAWRVISQQYVPYRAALAQHKGMFFGAGVVPAS